MIRHIGKAYILFALFLLATTGCKGKTEKKEVHKDPEVQKLEAETKAPGPIAQSLLSIQDAFMSVADKATPAVVNISAIQVTPGGQSRLPVEIDPFFRDFLDDFFGEVPRQSRKSSSLGSGVIIDSKGYILTNYHVVKDAEDILLKLSDRTEYKGKMVGADPKTDLAVIKVAASAELPYASLGDSDKIRVGQWAIAIGNPFGLDKTFTVGVISATGRSEVGVATYESFIQTDASINPGNSGGPLLDINGDVIGINTAIVASGQGIGFAVPINMAKGIVADLIKKGRVTRGWLGIGIQSLNAELADSFGVKDSKGALINEVFPGGPAGKAGIKPGDIIIRFNGKEIDDSRGLQNMVAAAPIGSIAEIEALREGKAVSFKLRIAEMPSDEDLVAASSDTGSDLIGITVGDLTPDIRESHELQEGVLVVDVQEGSPAERGGIQPGDIVIAINQNKILGINGYKKVVSRVRRGASVSFLVRRQNATLYLAFRTRR